MGNCQNFSNDETKKIAFPIKGNSQVLIKAFTWFRDSHGLFDYECKNVGKRQFKVSSSSGKLVRSGNDVLWIGESENLADSSLKDQELVQLYFKDGTYWIGYCDDTKSKKIDKNVKNDQESLDINDNLWLVVKSLKFHNSKGYRLLPGDLIKLGRVKFRIKEIKPCPYTKLNEKDTQKNIKNDEVIQGDTVKKSNSLKDLDTSKSSKMCRICLFETCEPDDPFVSPCNCSGTMKYIHLKCLQNWLQSRLHIKVNGHCTSIQWKSFDCELCKQIYPESFMIEDGKKIDLVEIPRPDCAYIMLEILNKETGSSKGVYIINMETKTNLLLGRGHDSDIRITDISVSRCHAMIKLENGNFYIEDNNSKFGTLVYINKPLALIGDYDNCQIQAGRTLLDFKYKKDWNLMPAWFSAVDDKNNNKTSIDIHNNQNNDFQDEVGIDNHHIVPYNDNIQNLNNEDDNIFDQLDINIEEHHINGNNHNNNQNTGNN